MRDRAKMPTQVNLMWPTLCALKRLGDSASIRELDDQVSTDLGLEDAILEELHGNGPQTEFANRCGWARTRLRGVGAVDTSGSGVWTITEFGRQIGSADKLRTLDKERRAQKKAQRKQHNQLPAGPSEDGDVGGGSGKPEDEAWQSDLIAVLRELKPDAFERLCQQLLREHGFKRVEVTGRPGDDGIDGIGILGILRMNLLSFHVSFQCKRYTGTVGPGSIRDFRGALDGRADKGLFITTGTFSKAAQREAIRDGAMAIDLINGEDLCLLLRKKDLGVVTETVVRVEPEFFDTL